MRFVCSRDCTGISRSLDLYVTVRFARWTGVPVWVWLGICGRRRASLLLRNERIAFRARTVAALHGEQSLLRGLVDSGRKVLAGFLLMLPGVVSDLIALALLAAAAQRRPRLRPQPPARARTGGRRDAIDGDFRRVD